ncbi:hypothetical protein GGH96_004607 [Coemansia sp. RSA 1972]|nr:hypothetical protein GGH96_004607 [Coemansia sp. RSA 1972]
MELVHSGLGYNDVVKKMRTRYLTEWCLEVNKDLEDQDRAGIISKGMEDLGRAGIINKDLEDLEDLEDLDLVGLACVRHKEGLVDPEDLADTDSNKDLDLEDLAVTDSNKDLEEPEDPGSKDPANSALRKATLEYTG